MVWWRRTLAGTHGTFGTEADSMRIAACQCSPRRPFPSLIRYARRFGTEADSMRTAVQAALSPSSSIYAFGRSVSRWPSR
jgi:hypothetical protein